MGALGRYELSVQATLLCSMSAHTAPSVGIDRHKATRFKEGWMYVPRSQRGYSFNAVIPLRGGGEAFPAMLAAIASAEHHVHLEMYILRDDRTGQEFKEHLIERRRAGVTVRVMYDSLGSLGLSSAYLNELRHEGVEVIE